MQIITRTMDYALVQTTAGYLIGEAVDEVQGTLVDDTMPATFRDWKSLVEICTAVALAVLKSEKLLVAAKRLLGDELAEFPAWLPLVGTPPTEHANTRWFELATKYSPEYDQSMIVWGDFKVGEASLYERGDSLILAAQDRPAVLTAEQVIELASMILSDGRTISVCPEQYSPFLAAKLLHQPAVMVKVGKKIEMKLPLFCGCSPQNQEPKSERELPVTDVSVLALFRQGYREILARRGF